MRNSRRAGKPAGRKPEKQGLTGLFTKGKNIPTTAQQTLPYREMYRDGVCRVADRYYTKTIEYEDINYQLAQSEDQAAIFDGWSACLNYFDSSLPFQLSFLNHRSRPGSRYSVNIPMQDDDYNSVRCEYVEMLENQIAKSNNGIVRTKLLTFGVNVDDLSTARARLERVEADICGNFKKLGVKCRSLSGLERLELLHGQLHPGSGSPFRFSWDMIPKTGLSTKDFIAPDSFDFRFSRLFRVGTTWGAASYLQILASELSDKLLAELLEMDAEMTITLHIQTVDQAAAVKSIKAKVSDIDKMKVEEQKKAARSGYDMDILPPDLVTYSNDAKTLLEDLQSRNERMFLLTFLVVNMAPTRRELDNDLFTVSGIVQKYNCTLKRLDFQQEDGFLSSLPLGHNGIEIKRGMTTSSTAIFVPFMTQELRMDGEAVYYGLNALSHNVIMANRKKLKNPNGLFLGVPGSGTTAVMMGALTLNSGMPTWQAVAITLVTGVLIGAMQGSFIAFLNVPPFIATLSGELVFRGLTQVVLQGQTLSPFSDGFKFFASGFVLRDVEVFGVNAVCLVCLILGTAAIIFSELKKRRSNKKYGFAQTSIFVSVAKCVFLIAVLAAILLSLSTHNGMPFILLVMAVLAIVYTFIANKTVLGRHVYMVGGNPKAAKLSGVRTDLVMLAVYTNMAFLSTIAGFVVAGRLNAASPKAGTGYELDAIAACTIGGAGSASGTIMGSIIGATVMAILNNGMSILGIGTDMQQVIKGCILLLAVTFDIYSKTKSKK